MKTPLAAPAVPAAAVFLLSVGLVQAGATDEGNGGGPPAGPLIEGKIYRRVNGHALRGKDIGSVLVEQGKRWEEGIELFAERILVREEMERRGLSVGREEIDEAIRRTGRALAAQRDEDPRAYSLEKLARLGGTSLHFLREQMRSTLGLKKILVAAGKLPKKARLSAPAAKQIMEDYLKQLVKSRGVESDPKKLGPGEALRIGGRGYSREEARAFILRRLGPLQRGQLTHALEILTLEYLVKEALKNAGVEKLSSGDQDFYLRYRALLMEYEQGVPPGEGGRALMFQIQQKGYTRESFLADRVIASDAGITCLARKALGEKDLRAEWETNKKQYQRTEKVLAHLFIRVRDPQGRPYTPRWKVPGHERLNGYVARVREERFAARKKDLLACLGAARADFAAAVKRFSEDEQTKKDTAIPGLLGRVGPRTLLTGVPVDRGLLLKALKLKAGEVSGPLRSAYGWHLVKCIEEQKTNYEEARPRIYVMLLKRKRASISQHLLRKAKVEDSF